MTKLRVYRTTLLSTLLLLFVHGCTDKPDISTPPAGTQFAKGADVSWVSEMEASGKKFYNPAGVEQDIFLILKNFGMNAIRLRVWVNPAGGWNNKADVIAKAIRAKNAGMRIMIDFHYSDWWADPGQQTKPAAWASEDFATLQQLVYNHTYDVLSALKASGINPEWVQVGNETSDGMLWPTGKASVDMRSYALLHNRGYDAVKAINPAIKVIVHLNGGENNPLHIYLLDGLRTNGGKWDIIGLSLYPEVSNWQSITDQCIANITSLSSKYGTPVMLTEVGMSWDEPTICKNFLSNLIIRSRGLPGNVGLGVFYWEPQSYNNWQGYTKGAFDNAGKPTVALTAFQ